MTITLLDAMKTFPFSEARLIAGHAGLSRDVSSANIQEVPDVDRWLKGGEILFTAGYAFGSAKNGCEMMKRLDEKGVAALVIKPGQYLAHIPQEMVDLANCLGLPLFELPEDMPYMDCIISIYELITQKQLIVLRHVEKVHDMLTETILNQQGLDGICGILNRVMGNPVFITSTHGIILACKTGREENGGGEYPDSMKSLLEDYLGNNKSHRLQWNKCNTVNLKSGVNLVVVPIYVKQDHIAYLVLDTTGKTPTDADMVAFEQVSNMVAVELLNERALWLREQKVREHLLEDLLMKRYEDEKMVIQRGKHLGIDLTDKFCLFVIDADSFEEVLKSGMADLSENQVQHIKDQVQQKIRSDMNAYSRSSLILESSVGAVGMISARSEADVTECSKMVGDIITNLGKLSPSLTFSAGLSRVKQGIQNVEQARREAWLAMRAGRGMNRSQVGPGAYCFHDLGCLCFLSELSRSEAARDFYEENMRTLLSYDRENNSELVKTLEYYYVFKQNLRKTAEALFVHKNSVIYRLGKIESLLKRKLSDHQTAFDMQLCLKLRNIF